MPVSTPNAAAPQILCISSYFPEHGGGVERVAHDIAQHFAEQMQWQTTLAAHDTGGTAEVAPALYARHPLGCWNGIEAMTGFPLILPNPFDTLRLLALIGRSDLVMVHEEIYLANFVSIVWALLTGKPLIVVKHTGIVPLKNRPFLNWLLKTVTRFISRPLLRLAKRVVFVTQAKRDNYDPEHTIRDALVVINGIDTTCFSLPGHGAARKGVVFVGRFIASKGTEILRHITRELSDIPFTLVGWGPENPEDWGHDNVTIVRRPSRPEIAEAMRRSELALVPSLEEGPPLVAMEALSCGTRVLIGEGSTVRHSDVTPLLVTVPTVLDNPVESAQVWSAAVLRILGQADNRSAQEARHETIEHGHSTRAMCAPYADLVEQILATRRRSA